MQSVGLEVRETASGGEVRIDVIARLRAPRIWQLLDLLNGAFLAGPPYDLFAEKQEVRMLQGPYEAVRASTHFMRFQPGLQQPKHHHPGDRLLITIGSSRLDVFSASDERGRDVTKVALPPNSIGVITIPSGVWHWFETSKSGRGAVAFSFHPFDDIDVNGIGTLGLMQRLTEFSRER